MRLVPPSIHPDVISRHIVRDVATGETTHDEVLNGLVRAAENAHKMCCRVETTHEAIMKNEMSTTIANEARSRQVIFEAQQSALMVIDNAIALAVAARDSETAKFANPPKAKNVDEATVASDTRAALARMPSNKRMKAVETAITAGEDAVVSAVLNAPSLTSGFSKTEIDAIRTRWARHRFPDAVDRADRLDRAINDLARGGSSVIGYCNHFTDERRVRGAMDSEKAAKTAYLG